MQPVLGRRGTYKEGGVEAGTLSQLVLSGLQGPGQVQN